MTLTVLSVTLGKSHCRPATGTEGLTEAFREVSRPCLISSDRMGWKGATSQKIIARSRRREAEGVAAGRRSLTPVVARPCNSCLGRSAEGGGAGSRLRVLGLNSQNNTHLRHTQAAASRANCRDPCPPRARPRSPSCAYRVARGRAWGLLTQSGSSPRCARSDREEPA